MAIDERWHVSHTAGADILEIKDENGLIVAGLKCSMRTVTDRKVDARLLAAAPHLADALSWARTFITDPGGTGDEMKILTIIDAALNAVVED